MEAFSSVRLGRKSSSNCHDSRAVSISHFAFSPLGKSATPPGARCRSANDMRMWRGASARADKTSAFTGSSLSERSLATVTSSPISRAAMRRNAVLRTLLSTSVICKPGRRSGTIAAITKPGNPPPDPRSIQCRESGGASARSWAESRKCLVHMALIVDFAIRLIRSFERFRRSSYMSSRANVSRETLARHWNSRRSSHPITQNVSDHSGEASKGSMSVPPVSCRRCALHVQASSAAPERVLSSVRRTGRSDHRS